MYVCTQFLIVVILIISDVNHGCCERCTPKPATDICEEFEPGNTACLANKTCEYAAPIIDCPNAICSVLVALVSPAPRMMSMFLKEPLVGSCKITVSALPLL